jgi:hypothetical protein
VRTEEDEKVKGDSSPSGFFTLSPPFSGFSLAFLKVFVSSKGVGIESRSRDYGKAASAHHGP